MKTTLVALALSLPGVGCMMFRPVGPLASTEKPTATRSPDNPSAVVVSPKDIPSMPVIEEGPRPPRPAYEVTPGEVNVENYQDAIVKLRKEIGKDNRALETMPRYPEVSRIKR